MDFIAKEKNREGGLIRVFCQGNAKSLAFDDWVSILNRRLRPATTSAFISKDGSDVKETIKAIAKALED